MYGSFLAVTGILSIVATFRYELAILLPEKGKDALKVFLLATIISFIFCLLALFIVPLINNSPNIQALTKIDSGYIFFLIPAGIFLYDLTKTTSYLANRKKQYKWLSYGRIAGSFTTGGLGIVFGLIGWSATGLIIGKVIGWLMESLVFLFPSWKSVKNIIPETKRQELKSLAGRYRNFPKYSTPEGLLNTGFKQIPILLLTAWFSMDMAGFYSMAFMLLSKPLGMVSAAFGQVFFQQGAALDREHQGSLKKLFKDNLKFLFFLAVVPCLVIALFAPQIFTFILGDNWETTGVFVRWLMPFSFITFLKGPFSAMVDIKNKIGQNVLFEIGFFIISIMAFYIGFLKNDPLLGVQCFSFGCSVLGLFQLRWFYALTGVSSKW